MDINSSVRLSSVCITGLSIAAMKNTRSMKSCAFLTMDSLDGHVSDDEMAIDALSERGFAVEFVSWRDATKDWSNFDIVVIRSPWDYFHHFAAFKATLEEIHVATLLVNPLELVLWNLSKLYLREIEAAGIEVVPTLWFDNLDTGIVAQSLEAFDTCSIVVKPLVSGGAEGTFILSEQTDRHRNEAEQYFQSKAVMVQPYLESIVDFGEISLFYFDAIFSHAVRKLPRENDFRVQEEFGGSVQAIVPDTTLLNLGARVLGMLTPVPTYARIDIVRVGKSYAVIELELVEPSLYFRFNEHAVGRFADAIVSYYNQNISAPGK